MRLFVISALVIAFLAILFALQNTNLVIIQFFIWKYQQSLALVLLGTLALGVIVGLLVSFPAIIRRNYQVSRMRKQTDTLTELVQEKERAVDVASRKAETVKHNYGDLLTSLGLIEPVTGVLRDTLVPQALSTQLQKLISQAETQAVPSLGLLLFQVMPEAVDGYRAEDVFAAAAHSLQKHATVSTWFYSNGQGRFTATIPNVDVPAATRYSEELQTLLLKTLQAVQTERPLKADVSVGGAIAEDLPAADAPHLIDTAEQALEQALQRGRNRVRILQAS